MPEVEFKIDTERGTCETEIKGYHGPMCEKAARQLKEVLGDPSTEVHKEEYFVTPRSKQVTRRK